MKVSRKQFVMVREHDDYPDTSWIGEYSDTPGPGAIDREALGDKGHNEFRYFNPANTAEETGNPESPVQDYRRMERLNTGELYFVGIRAHITLTIAGIAQRIESPGLWGVESDTPENDIQDIFSEECNTLANMLTELGTIELVD